MSVSDNEINIKLVILGKGGVGKSSLVKAFLENQIQTNYIPTIGYNIKKKEYSLKNNKVIIKLNIWDTGGQRSFNPLNPATFTDADIALLVFDLSNPLETVQNLKQDYEENLENYSKNCIKFTVGNKLDLIRDRDILIDIIKSNFSNNDEVLLVSAKTGENINDAFESIIYNFLNNNQIKFRNINLEGILQEFLKIIKKNEKKLNEQFVSSFKINSIIKKKEKKPKITKEIMNSPVNINLINYDLIQEELQKIQFQKKKLITNFKNKLSEVEELINFLENSKIELVKESIETLKEQLIDVKKEFEFDLVSLNELEKEKEFVLQTKTEIPIFPEEINYLESDEKISQENSITSEPSTSIIENDLYKLYEIENPRKKAIWRGKETKAFKEWKKYNYK